ncbi:MAG: TrpR-like protein, YerC/YecD [Clostridia bacterium]|nr:TrpR-like protein, YerC/YecD [Clostridia bacterium]
MSKIQNQEIDQLFEAILSLQSVEECYKFFEDACTIKEINEIAQRFEVACRLDAGQNYQEVNKETGASTATICRVNKCLNYGNEGYRTVIDRLKKEGKLS